MINTDKIYRFYKSEKKTQECCKYITHDGYKCQKLTDDIYCDIHNKIENKNKVTADRAVKFLKFLSDNPMTLNRLLYNSTFYLKRHNILTHDKYKSRDRDPYNSYEYEHCEECYSCDTEHDENDDFKNIACDVFKIFWTEIKDEYFNVEEDYAEEDAEESEEF